MLAPQLELRVAINASIKRFGHFVWKRRDSLIEQLTNAGFVHFVQEPVDRLEDLQSARLVGAIDDRDRILVLHDDLFEIDLVVEVTSLRIFQHAVGHRRTIERDDLA